MITTVYRGRIAPSPTGFLHLGHAMTFWHAQERARQAGGKLILRIEDLDRDRCRKEFADAISEDLRWFGLDWDEGPNIGGPFAPYVQGERRRYYLEAWEKLRVGGFIYPCKCSRKDVAQASLAPHESPQGAAFSGLPSTKSAADRPPQNFERESIYPGTCRPNSSSVEAAVPTAGAKDVHATRLPPQIFPQAHWRFRVPDDERIDFVDERLGKQSAVASRDFGDFIVWRRDDVPAYQLAVVVDDATMQISEVVRGEDLLMSTFRQLLLYRALNLRPPKFYHAPLVLDESGKRLAKRHGALSLRALRERGARPEELRALRCQL